jgi:hypothetical protein
MTPHGITGLERVKWTKGRIKYLSREFTVISVFGVIVFRKKYAVIA